MEAILFVRHDDDLFVCRTQTLKLLAIDSNQQIPLTIKFMSLIKLTAEGLAKLATIVSEDDMDIVTSQIYYFMQLHTSFYKLTPQEVKTHQTNYQKCKTRRDFAEFACQFDLNLVPGSEP